MRIEELDTPSVVIDLDTLERNLARMGSYCQETGIKLRPHTKTHKIPAIAKLQIASGASGVTVAKVSEAEVMVGAGIYDVLVAFPIVSGSKAAVLAGLAHKANVTVSLDSIEAAQSLSQCGSREGSRIGILVEIDVGLHRCGVATPDAAARLAGKITALPGVELKGIMFYPGHMLADHDGQSRLIPAVNATLDECYDLFQKAGLPTAVVSGGSTPTAYRSHEFHGVTEIRPGMYAFYDRNMLAIGACQLKDCAASVLVTVVSTAVEGAAIVDGGSKTFSSDRFLAGDGRGYGKILQDEAAELAQMSEEHGHLDISKSSRRYSVGERLNIIPNHVCTTINMHDEIYGVRGGVVEETWKVAARGRVR